MSFFKTGNESSSDDDEIDETNQNSNTELNESIEENEDNDNSHIKLLDKTIIIFGEIQGRKINTFIIGWDCTEDERKTALEKMKKSFGCGGSLKNIEYEGKTVNAIHLQGNQIVKGEKYLIKNTVSLKIIAKYL